MNQLHQKGTFIQENEIVSEDFFTTAIKEKNAAYLAKQFSKCIYFRNTQIQGSHLLMHILCHKLAKRIIV